jgi:hypothetical protein
VFTNVTTQAGIAGEALAHSAICWDFDNAPDLLVANGFMPADRLYRNNHDGTFTEVINDVVPHLPYSSMGADLGDVNNDGLIDLIVGDMAATTHGIDQRAMATSRALGCAITRQSAPCGLLRREHFRERGYLESHPSNLN